MTPLPTRLAVRHRYDDLDAQGVRELTATIMYAYELAELMTAAQWRATIDYEAGDEAVAAYFWPCEPRGSEDISVSRIAVGAATKHAE